MKTELESSATLCGPSSGFGFQTYTPKNPASPHPPQQVSNIHIQKTSPPLPQHPSPLPPPRLTPRPNSGACHQRTAVLEARSSSRTSRRNATRNRNRGQNPPAAFGSAHGKRENKNGKKKKPKNKSKTTKLNQNQNLKQRQTFNQNRKNKVNMVLCRTKETQKLQTWQQCRCGL